MDDDPTTLFLTYLGGVAFFYSLYNIAYGILRLAPIYRSRLGLAKATEISMWLVSATQAITACLAGAVISSSCSNDLMRDSHPLTNVYTVFATGYLTYDLWAMYRVYQVARSGKKSLLGFMADKPTMMFHHIALPCLFVPVVLYFRKGQGDFFVGCFMFIEATVPFIAFRDILLQVNKKHSIVYLANGCMILITYTLSRICIFPLLFGVYARSKGMWWWQVPAHIPSVCTFGISVFFALYVYWWKQILITAREEFSDLRQTLYGLTHSRSTPTTSDTSNNNEGPVHLKES